MKTAGIAVQLTSLIISLGLLIILFSKIKSSGKYIIFSVLYLVVISLLLAFPSIFNLMGTGFSEMTLLIIAQSFIIFIGILHVFLVSSMLSWYRKETFGMRMIFVLCILFFSYSLNNLSFSLQEKQFSPVWHVSLLWFLIPVLLKKAGDELMNVPAKTYKLWYYPVNHGFEDPSEQELENPVIISLIFRKNEKSRDLTTFRVKAPVGMKFGQLFYYFINDYNDRHPESAITYLADERESFGWIFEKTNGGLFRKKEIVDPESSVYSNEIKENDLLYCKRILKNT